MSVYQVRVGMALDGMIFISPIRTCVQMLVRIYVHILVIGTVWRVSVECGDGTSISLPLFFVSAYRRD